MEILLQSHKIKEGNREKLGERLQKLFLNIVGWSADAKQKNVIIEHVCGIEAQRQKSNAKRAYEYNCGLSILKNFVVNKATEQENSKNLCPRAMHNGRSLIKSQSMPNLF